MIASTHRLSMLAVLASWLLAVTSSSAATLPQVRDNGKFFKADAVKKANEIIGEIHDRYKKDLVIETVNKVPADIAEALKKADEDKTARNRIFDRWARELAQEKGVQGVFVLISREPEHVQVEVGNDTAKKAFTIQNRNHLAKLLLEEFRQKDYDSGLVKGTEYVRDSMATNLGKGGARTEGGSFWSSLMGMLCIGLVVVLGIWLVIGLIRGFSGGGMGGGMGGMGGGGFFTSLLGGMVGAAAGMWLYDSFFRGGSQAFGGTPGADASTGTDTDYSGSGGDVNDGDAGGGGDFGGDAGGGDMGGGDFGGGDFGGGGFGGGDF